MQTYIPSEDKKVAERVYSTSIDGLFYIQHATFGDERGFFSEVAKIPSPYLEKVLPQPFVIKQINHARSQENVIRGFHTEGWNKYIAITKGICFSAIADVRPDSKTYGKTERFLLGHGEGALDGSIYIPAACGNSMCVVKGPVDYMYFVDEIYENRDPSGDIAISLFDPDIAMEWPIPREKMIISERDLTAITLKEKYPDNPFKKNV